MHIVKLLLFLNIIIGSNLVFAQDIPQAEFAKCSLTKNDIQRLSCFDNLSKKYELNKPASKIVNKGNWAVQTDISPIDDSTNVYLAVPGDQAFKGWLKSYNPQLMLRCKENVTELLIHTGMAPDVEYGHRGATTTLRYDTEKAYKLRMSKSTDGEALFFPNPISNIKKMMNHSTLLFQFTPYNASPTMTTFKISGLSEAAKPLREHCGW